MNPHVIQDAWEQAKLLLVVGGQEWPKAFDALDIARLSMEPPLRADALVNKLRDVPASGSWCCRGSNIVGHYQTDTGGIDGPASFPVWRRGNDLHYLLVANGRKEQMIARRMHTAEDIREFYRLREQEPPGLLASWIASEDTAEQPEKTVKPKAGRKPSNAPTRLAEILVALEEFARATHQEFDRDAMPGPLGESYRDKGSFHWLCASIDPVFRKAKTTFKKHRAGLCAMRAYANQTDFYRRALPHIAPKFMTAANAHRSS